MNTQKPNILVIMADQMAGPALPFYGHTLVQTPHLNALAQGGVVFSSAYCNSPLCAPSRASMMTGQLPSRIGAFDNAAEFPASIPTLGHYLRDMGYRTSLCGKMHFAGPDQLHGFEERLTTDIYPADLGWTPDWERPAHRPSWYHNMLSIVQAGTCQTSNQLDFDEKVAFDATRKIYEMARDRELTMSGHFVFLSPLPTRTTPLPLRRSTGSATITQRLTCPRSPPSQWINSIRTAGDFFTCATWAATSRPKNGCGMPATLIMR